MGWILNSWHPGTGYEGCWWCDEDHGWGRRRPCVQARVSALSREGRVGVVLLRWKCLSAEAETSQRTLSVMSWLECISSKLRSSNIINDSSCRGSITAGLPFRDIGVWNRGPTSCFVQVLVIFSFCRKFSARVHVAACCSVLQILSNFPVLCQYGMMSNRYAFMHHDNMSWNESRAVPLSIFLMSEAGSQNLGFSYITIRSQTSISDYWIVLITRFLFFLGLFTMTESQQCDWLA